MAYACPQCDRLVPEVDVDVAARHIRCESCGRSFEGVDLAPLTRWSPSQPPPPVMLSGIPANVDVVQPGDGTIRFRIHHLIRLRHGPEAGVWVMWVFWCLVGAGFAWHADKGPIALLAVLMIWPGARGLWEIRNRARSWTIVLWDRVNGALRVHTEGPDSPEDAADGRHARFGETWDLAIRIGQERGELVSKGPNGDVVLAEGVPFNATAWVITTMKAMKS